MYGCHLDVEQKRGIPCSSYIYISSSTAGQTGTVQLRSGSARGRTAAVLRQVALFATISYMLFTVAVHDNRRAYQPWEKPYYVLSAGDVYNMKTRKIEKLGIGARGRGSDPGGH